MSNRKDAVPDKPDQSNDDNDNDAVAAGQGSSDFNQTSGSNSNPRMICVVQPVPHGGQRNVDSTERRAYDGLSTPPEILIHLNSVFSPNSDDEIQPAVNNNVLTTNTTVTLSYNGFTLIVLPERKSVALTPNIVPYKIYDTMLQGMLISCINVEPFSDEKLMVTLENIVQTLLYPYSFQSCHHIIQNKLQTKLYYGNSEQMELLFQKKLVKSMLPEDVPIVMYDDLTNILVRLKQLLRELHRETFDNYESDSGDDVLMLT